MLSDGYVEIGALTTPAAIREASTLIPSTERTSAKPYLETIIIREEASATTICVLIPALFCRISLSIPISAPKTTAARRRRNKSIISTLMIPRNARCSGAFC